MNIESKLSGHWTDEQLIEHLYGVGSDNQHIEHCSDCRARLSKMQAARGTIEARAAASEEVPFDLLAAQRRKIYARVGQIARGQLSLQIRRWAAAAAMVVLLGGGAFFYEQNEHQRAAESKMTDAQLAQEVSRMAQDSEPSPTAPLQALFDE
jgi:predicted anti-sigma-YlaC factor YlaD